MFVYCTLVFAITRYFPENRPRNLHRFTALCTVDTCSINFISIFLESLVCISPERDWLVFNTKEATKSRSKSSLLLTCARRAFSCSASCHVRPALSCSASCSARPVLSCWACPVLLVSSCPARRAPYSCGLSCHAAACPVLLGLSCPFY
jgi:hypothetical protein